MSGKEPAVGQPQKTKTHAGGRPSTFSKEIADELCARLATGDSLRKVCEADDMPAIRTVMYWLRSDDEFLQQYTRAKEEAADSLADDIQDIGAKTLAKTYNPQAARVAIEAYKWTASKLKPKKYGDKIDVTSGGDKIERGMTIGDIEAVLARAEAEKAAA